MQKRAPRLHTNVASIEGMTNTDTKKLSKTDAKYDWIKLILSLCILAIHAKVYPMVLFPWLRLAVPLFFIISYYFSFFQAADRNAGGAKDGGETVRHPQCALICVLTGDSVAHHAVCA